jgi:hypothetical protein
VIVVFEIDDRERRQLQAMLVQIGAFEARRLGLSGLISSLEALFATLDQVSPDWRNEFGQHLGVLEEVYAVATKEGRSPSSLAEDALIDQATRSLRRLVLTNIEAD